MKKFILLTFTAAFFGVIYNVFSNSVGITSFTGSPGEVTCSVYGCHGAGNGNNSSGGLSDNAGGGSISISGISDTYTPGKVYKLIVKIKQKGGTKFGFNATALNEANGMAGTLKSTLTGTYIGTGVGGSRQAISHGYTGPSGTIAGTGIDSFEFSFDWTAPDSSVGPVKIYASGVVANLNGIQDAGDNVYKTSVSLTPDVSSIPRILVSRANFNFPSFFALANTVGNTQSFFVSGQNINGDLSVDVSGSQFLISKSATGPWSSNIPLAASSGTVNGTILYVQYTGGASGTQTGTISVSGGGASSKAIALSGSVKIPSIAAPSVDTLNFGVVDIGSGISFSKTFTVQVSSPISGTTFTCPPGYEISTFSGHSFSANLTPFFTGFGTTYTCYVRLKNPQSAGTLNGNLIISTPGTTARNIYLKTTVKDPSKFVLATKNNLKLFKTNPATPSARDSFNVSGSGLTANLVVKSTSKFEVSLTSNSGFGNSIAIPNTSGKVASTTIYVRYLTNSAGLDLGEISINSTGATEQLINVTGVCSGNPATIITSGSITPFTSVISIPSSVQNFTVSGNSLSSDLIVTAPTHFEVSQSSSSGFGPGLKVTPVSGTVSNITLYVRFLPSIAGNHSGDIVISTIGAVDQKISVNGIASASNINSFSKDNLFSIYPNPCQGILNIRPVKPIYNSTIVIYDPMGKKVFMEKINLSHLTIDLRQYASGTYTLKLTDENGSVQGFQKFLLVK